MAKKKRKAPEYTLNIFLQWDERTKKQTVVFLVRTTKEFTNFNYDILLESSFKENELRLKILGLRTTPLIMPNIGPAQGYRQFELGDGPCSLIVEKIDGEKNFFRLIVSPDRIEIVESDPHPFLLVSNKSIPFPHP